MGCGNSKTVDISEKHNIVNNNISNNNMPNNNNMTNTHVQSNHIQNNTQPTQNVIQHHSSQHQTCTTVTYQQNSELTELEKERLFQNYQQNQQLIMNNLKENQKNTERQKQLLEEMNKKFLEHQKNPNAQSQQDFFNMCQQFMQNQQDFQNRFDQNLQKMK